MTSRYNINGRSVAKAAARELNCDSLVSFEQRLGRYGRPFYIGVITSPQSGLGDIAFGIKFIEHLVERYKDYPNIYISFFLSDENRNYLTMALDRLKIANVYNAYGELVTDPIFEDATGAQALVGNDPHSKVTIYQLQRTQGPSDVYNATQAAADIIFISPGTNIVDFVITTTRKNIHEHTYVMSEYNPSNSLNQYQAASTQEVSIITGVYDEQACLNVTNLCPTGIFIADDIEYPRPYFILESEHYSVTYIYTSPGDINDKYRTDTPDKAPHNLETVLQQLHVDHQASDCLPHTKNWRRGMLMMTTCFYHYLQELEKYRHDNKIRESITVYYKGSLLDDYKFFIAVEREMHPRPEFEQLWDWLTNPKTLFIFKLTPPALGMNEMLGFFQHSIPITFLSGDNTPAEFISVNRNPTIKLVYAAFFWKRALAKALGVTVESGNGYNACGVATIDRKQFLRNVRNNFDVAGMQQVEALIVKSMLGRAQTCENADFRTIVQRVLEGNHFVYQPAVLDSSTIQFQLADDVFNTSLIRGDISSQAGGEVSAVAKTSWSKKHPSDVFIKFIDYNIPTINCKNFTLDLNSIDTTFREDRVIGIHPYYSAVLISYLINKIILDLPDVAPFLIQTYATVLSAPCGAGSIQQQFVERSQTDGKGIYLIQEYIQHTLLRDYIRCQQLSPKELYEIMAQLIYTLVVLQVHYQFVHNDLWAGNVMIEFHQEPVQKSFNIHFDDMHYNFNFFTHYQVRLMDLDNASFDLFELRFISTDGFKYKHRTASNFYDLAYIMGDMFDIYEKDDFKTDASCTKTGLNKGDTDLRGALNELATAMNLDQDSHDVNDKGARVPKLDIPDIDLQPVVALLYNNLYVEDEPIPSEVASEQQQVEELPQEEGTLSIEQAQELLSSTKTQLAELEKQLNYLNTQAGQGLIDKDTWVLEANALESQLGQQKQFEEYLTSILHQEGSGKSEVD